MKNLHKDVTFNKSAGFVSVNKIEREIAERPLVPNSSQLYKFSAKYYSENGFYISCVSNSDERREIDLLQDNLQKETFATRNSNLPVFNSFSNEDPRAIKLRKNCRRGERVDGGRNMIHISLTTDTNLKKQSILVGNIVERMIAEDLHLDLTSLKGSGNESKTNQMVLTVLETEGPIGGDSVPDQLMHCDVDTDDSTLDAKDAFIGILATQSGATELRVLPRSHRITKSGSYNLPTFIYRVQLPQYFYLVGHPFLIHGGCGSGHRNTRIHFYHGLSEDSQSKTFFVPWEVKDTTKQFNLMRSNSEKVRKAKANKRKRLLK